MIDKDKQNISNTLEKRKGDLIFGLIILCTSFHLIFNINKYIAGFPIFFAILKSIFMFFKHILLHG